MRDLNVAAKRYEDYLEIQAHVESDKYDFGVKKFLARQPRGLIAVRRFAGILDERKRNRKGAKSKRAKHSERKAPR